MAYIGSPAAPAIATVSDDTITSAKIADGTITSADLASGVTDLVNDTTPQLGGDLDLNSKILTGTLVQDANVSKSTDTATTIAQFGTNDASDPLAIKFTARTGQGSNNYIAMDCGEGSSNRSFVIGYTGSERMRIDSSGRVMGGGKTSFDVTTAGWGLGSGSATGFVLTNSTGTSGDELIFLNRTNGSGSSMEFEQFYYNTSLVGSITCTSSSTSYNTSSDYRLKEDWQPMSGSIDRVKALNPVNFAWKADGSRVDGFLAHEAQEVVPEAITGTKDAVDADGNPEYQGIDQSKLVPLLTAALQEAITKIETLEARVATLESA